MRAWKQPLTGQNAENKTYFLYDGSTPVCELDSTGHVSATNTWGVSGLLSRQVTGDSTGSAFYLFNPQGNVTHRLNAQGQGQDAHTFDAWGNRLPSGNGQGQAAAADTTADPYSGFSSQYGGYRDAETSLVLMGHRYYDPQQGRFLSRDPLGYGGGLNLYAYADNNPTNEVDPSGLDPGDEDDGVNWNNLSLGGGIKRGGLIPDMKAGGQARTGLSDDLRATPAGVAMGAVEAITGCDYVAGTPVSKLQRGMGAVVAILAVVPVLGALGSDAHHIATNKHASLWTPIFKPMFEKFGLNIKNAPENQVYVSNLLHNSRHPSEYHQWVYDHLIQANTREEFVNQLNKLKQYILANPGVLKKEYGPYPNL